MPGARDQLDQQARDPARARPPGPTPGHVARPAITGAADPRLAAASSGARADLMHVQRTAGNAAAASLVTPSVQRAVTIDEIATDVAAPEQSAGGEPAGAAPADGSPAAEADHTINAAHIGLNAPIVEASGVLRAQTVVADSIVASSYTPGAGNEW